MTWFKVDDGFYDHPKVLNLSLAARGLWVTVGSWCAKHETDGEISQRQIRALGGTKRLVDQLVQARMLDEICTESAPNVYRMCSWSEWNPTSDELQAKRDAWRESKNRFREQKRAEQEECKSVQRGHSQVSNEVSKGVSSQESKGVSRTTDPTRPDPTIKKEGKKETADVTVEASPTPPPPPLDAPVGGSRASLGFAAYGTIDDPRCAKHKDLPRDQVPACRDCAHARQVLQERHEHEKQEARRLIDECPWCDERGIANLHDRQGRPVAVKCDHVHQPVPPPAPEGFKPLRTKQTQNTPKTPPSGPTEPRKAPDWYE